MQVILLQDIKSVGRRGDVKNVANGYARNFLLPRNLVKPATPVAVQEAETHKAKLEERLEGLKVELKNIGEATAAEPLVFQVKVGEKGEIFGSIGDRDIKEKLIEKLPKLQSTNLEVEADHIRELGRQEIEIKVKGIEGKITIEVQPQQP